MEAFELLDYKSVSKKLEKFYENYTTPRGISISTDVRLHECLQYFLLSFDVGEIPKLGADINSLRYLQQLLGIPALIYNSSAEEQTGWEIRSYLLLRLCFLLKGYLDIQHPEFFADNVEQKMLIEFIIKEVVITSNALNIYFMYQNLQGSEALEAFVKKLLSQVKENLSKAEKYDEISIPCGFVGHAVYLIFFKYNEEAVIRIDNAGRRANTVAKFSYNTPNGTLYAPIYIAQIPIAKLQESEFSQDLQNYLRAVFLAKARTLDGNPNPADVLYNSDSNNEKNQRFRLPEVKVKLEDQEKEFGMFAYLQQRTGNCVVENFNVGTYNRGFRYVTLPHDKANNHVFKLMYKMEIGFLIAGVGNLERSFLDYLRQYEAALQPKQIDFSGSMPEIQEKEMIVARPNLQSDLEKYFLAKPRLSNDPSRIAVLWGLTGYGTTFSATHYWQNSNKYSLRVWFTGEQIDSLYKQFALKFKIVLQNPMDASQIREDVKRWFTKRNNWLLIYDDIDHLEPLKKYLPNKGGDIIITSHEEQEGVLGKNFKFDTLTEDESIKFLKTRLMGQDDKLITTLAQNLEGNPLAIWQALSYIQNNGIEVYLSEIEISSTRLMKYPFFINNYKAKKQMSIATTWHATLNKLESKSPQALWLLENCAYLSNGGIPKILLEELVKCFPRVLNPNKEDVTDEEMDSKLVLDSLLNQLHKFALITIQADKTKINISKLHQVFIQWHDKVSRRLSVKELFDFRLELIVKALRTVYPYNLSDDSSSSSLMALSLKPHLETILKHLEKAFDECTEEDIRDSIRGRMADILAALANIYTTTFKLPDALNKGIKALDLFNSRVKYSRRMANIFTTMGIIHSFNNEEKNALGYYDKASQALDKVKGVKDLEMARLLNGKGVALRRLGFYSESLKSHNGAKKIREHLEKLDFAKSLNNLGMVCLDLGEIEDAHTHFHQSLTIYLQYSIKNSVLLANAKINCGHSHLLLGEFKEAFKFLKEAQDSLSLTCNDEINKYTIECENLMGEVQLKLGNLEDAYHIHEQTIKKAKSRRYDVRDLAESYLSWGNVTLEMAKGKKEKLEEAYNHFVDAHKINLVHYGELHSYSLHSQEKKAICKGCLGDKEFCIENLEDVFKKRQDLYKDHPDLALSLTNIANFYFELNLLPSAKIRYEKAKELYEKFNNKDPNNPKIKQYKIEIAQLTERIAMLQVKAPSAPQMTFLSSPSGKFLSSTMSEAYRPVISKV